MRPVIQTVLKELVPVGFPAPVRPGLETRSSVQTVAFPHCVICHAHPFTVLPDLNPAESGTGEESRPGGGRKKKKGSF